jgi:glycosyltransferase involved in cell wall biosynthesis
VAFTVVVPTRNRPGPLARCLEAVSCQDWPKAQLEVVVVDDGGEQPLDEVVAPFREQMNLKLLRIAHSGPAAARNHGARLARNGWLAFTDDDCEPAPDWLSALCAALREDAALLVGGSTHNGLRSNPCSEASQLILTAAYRYFNADPLQARFLASNNLACHRQAFLDAGGFDAAFRVASEDRELCDRWQWLGRPIRFEPAARVRHCHELSWTGFARQHFAYGRGAARFHRTRASRATGSLFSDLSFYARWSDLLLHPALATQRPLLVLALLAVWQAANTAGFCFETLLELRTQGASSKPPARDARLP